MKTNQVITSLLFHHGEIVYSSDQSYRSINLPLIKNMMGISKDKFCCQTLKGIAVFTQHQILIEYPIKSCSFELIGVT